MSYELEYEKSYNPTLLELVATPVKGHPSLPTLRLFVREEDLPSVIAEHRTRTLDPARPGITAYLFGKPGSIQIVHHDCEVLTVDSREAAWGHARPGEHDILRSAHDRQTPSSSPIVVVAEPMPVVEQPTSD